MKVSRFDGKTKNSKESEMAKFTHYGYSAERAAGLKSFLRYERTVDLNALREAVERKDADACYTLATLQKQRNDVDAYMACLKRAAEYGNGDAICELMDFGIQQQWKWKDLKPWVEAVDKLPYMESDYRKEHQRTARLYLQLSQYGFPREELPTAISACRSRAEAGDVHAMNTMARLCSREWVEDDPLVWYRRASVMVDVALKVEDDPLVWYRRAAEKGDADSIVCFVDRAGESWDGRNPPFKSDVEGLQHAADQGNPMAAFNLATHYYFGYGVEKSFETAFKYHRKAAVRDNVPALLNVADMAINGRGCAIDLASSEKALRRAAELGDGNACMELAFRLILGTGGCSKDLKEAGYWLIIGCKIVKLEASSDWRLKCNWNRILLLRQYLVPALAFYENDAENLLHKMVSDAEEMLKTVERVNDDPDGIVVNLHFIGACNFCCKTCYFPQDDFHLSVADWMTIIDQLATTIKVKRFNFAGGEPLLMPSDFLQKLIDRIHAWGIEVSIITNGYLLKPKFIEENRGKIQMIGISVDGTDEAMNQKIGRCTKSKSCSPHTLTNERLFELADTIHHAGIKLKINTQVMKPNCESDFHALIRRIAPDKWKLLQTTIREDVNKDVADWVLSKEAFEAFCQRHADLKPVKEEQDDIKNAYYMMFQYGEFVYVNGAEHRHLRPLLLGDTQESIGRIPHNKEGYAKRYSDEETQERNA